MKELPVGKISLLENSSKAKHREWRLVYYARADIRAKRKAYCKEYYKNNKKHIDARMASYRKTAEGKLLRTLHWRRKYGKTGMSRAEWIASRRNQKAQWNLPVTKIGRTERDALIRRISKRIVKDPTSNCWIYNGRKLTKRKVWYASFRGKNWTVIRLIYLITYHRINKYDTISHTCRIKECVNPKHLYVYKGPR